MMKKALNFLLRTLALFLLSPMAMAAEGRFPPPDFEGGYTIPATATPPPRGEIWQYIDMGVLLAALVLAVWLVHGRRSRRGIGLLSLASLIYFGFWRKGCVCAIGAVQNVAQALCDSHVALPVTALLFFLAPIAMALFAGRAFCAAVCPQGAIQDWVLVRPVRVPAWLERVLGLIPFFFLGAGVIFAATGAGFIICRFDPLVPFFRFSGSGLMMSAGILFLLVGMVIGRPYCRFLCPYGALLRMAGTLTKWRVRVTPDTCTQCALCRQSCPFGALREPDTAPVKPQTLRTDRRRLAGMLLLLPLLITTGVFAGARFAEIVAAPVKSELAWTLFGGWIGLVIGVQLVLLSLRRTRTDFEPDAGACVACARCFKACPSERIRLGIAPEEPNPEEKK